MHSRMLISAQSRGTMHAFGQLLHNIINFILRDSNHVHRTLAFRSMHLHDHLCSTCLHRIGF